MAEKLRVLKKADRRLLRSVHPKRIADLGVDDLLSLHKKVRRSRKKYLEQYRRRVDQDGNRPSGRSVTARHHASLFEDALARVSSELARSAHQHAESLRSAVLDTVRTRKAWKVGDARTRRDDRAGATAKKGGRKDARRSNGARW